MLKLFYHKKYYTNWCSELVILYMDLCKFYNIDDNRFEYLKKLNFNIEYVDDIKKCDYVVLPYKWRGFDETTNIIINDCRKNNKKILIFFNDDYSDDLEVSENDGFIFRTSMYKKDKKKNVFSMPPFIDDYFDSNFLNILDEGPSVGFCGYDHYQRKDSLEILDANKNIKTEFIIRKGFWAQGVPKDLAIKQFIDNMKNNLFGFSCRGAGNFSYRFYEILSMGRIPLLLNTDCVLPFDDMINYNDICVIVDESDLSNIDIHLLNFFKNKNEKLINQQKINREIYEEFLSPSGFINNFIKKFNNDEYIQNN